MISTIKQATQNILSRLNWKVYHSTIFSIITFLSVIPCTIFLPERFAWENSWIENSQLVILAITFYIAIKSNYNKKFFNWIAMIAVILFLREISYGRALFPKEGFVNVFKSWDEILPMCPWLSITLYISFMVYSLFYFFKNRLYYDVMGYVKSAKIAGWDFSFLFIGIIVGTISESYLHNESLEEMTETLFYVAFMSIVWIYSNISTFHLNKK